MNLTITFSICVILIKYKIFINVRQLIKKILKEEKEKDLSSAIKELLNNSIGPKYKGIICKFDAVAPWKMYNDPINRDYQVMVSVIGGVGSNRWPNTQHLVKERDKIVNETWHTIYNYLGISTDVFLRNVKSCDEVLTESSNERLEKLIGDYINMSYPTAQKFRLAPRGVLGSITTFTLPNPEDERDNLIFKFDVFGKPEYNINPEFFNSINSMFGTKRNIKKIILKWFEDKEIDVDLIQNPDTQKQEQNESEITERCWKGYTQKGMKTMFGKKYPNCVKIKKKRMNESKMLDYLKQFLSGEVLDNYKKEKGRKEFQNMVDIVYKITAKDNPIEGMAGVLVGHIDKSMWGTTYTDPNSVGSRWDFKVILKPLFTNYNPNNEPDYNERVLNFEKEFNDNARGMGFEVLSPIQHDKVKNYKVTFEWASRLDVKEIN